MIEIGSYRMIFMKQLLTGIFCLFVVTQLAAQRKCDSIFTIKVYDSLTHKPLQYATIKFDKFDKYQLIVAPTNKKGRATIYLPQKINADKIYLFNAAQSGYDNKDNIPLNLDCHCKQKVYLRRWDKADSAKFNVTIDDHNPPKSKRK